MACGERFTILVYGFVFSRVQTGDGKIGYVYSNMIAVDRARVGSGHAKSPGNNGARRSACVRTSTRFWIAPAHSSGSGNDRNPGTSFFCDHTSGRHVQCPGASRPT